MNPTWTGRQKLLYAAMTMVMFAVVMIGLSVFSRPYTDAAGGWLVSSVGLNGAFWLVIGAIPLLYAISWWFNRDSAPVVVPRKPLWFHAIGVVFLGVPIVCILAVIALTISGAIR